jgi:tRNA(Ile)-lysidine synthase
LLDTPQLLLQEPLLQNASAALVGLSGGLDSSVLLHLLFRLRELGWSVPLSALHVQHGLQAEAESWLEHCRQKCAALDIPFAYEHAQLGAARLSSEDAARQARYAAFARHLPLGGVLLQAHHQQDQVETVLFRLLRGSGVRGLGGMPRERRFASGWLLRPLLDLPRAELERYACEHQLCWVEDPSNAQGHYSRNFLRQHILPSLREHWPALDKQLLTSAARGAEAAFLLDELAAADLESAQGPHPSTVKLEALRTLSVARRNNLVRFWCRQRHGAAAPEPGAALLERLQTELLDAKPSATPVLRWGEGAAELTLRRHGVHVYLVPRLPLLPLCLELVVGEVLELPAPLGRLCWREGGEGGLALRQGERLQLRFRQGGERIKLAGRPSRELKKLLWELGIAPWLRDYVPLIYRNEQLLAAAGFAQDEAVLSKSQQNTLQLVWERPDLHCGA